MPWERTDIGEQRVKFVVRAAIASRPSAAVLPPTRCRSLCWVCSGRNTSAKHPEGVLMKRYASAVGEVAYRHELDFSVVTNRDI